MLLVKRSLNFLLNKALFLFSQIEYSTISVKPKSEIMKNLLLLTALQVFLITVSFAQNAGNPPTGTKSILPVGQPFKIWFIPENADRQNYEIYADVNIVKSGTRSASLKSNSDVINSEGKGTFLMQTIKAENFLGRKVRIVLWLKSQNTEDCSSWLRVEGEGMKITAQSNLNKNMLAGSFDWKRFEQVVNVPEGSQQITFGVGMRGKGQIWIDDIHFEEVGTNVPSTAPKPPSKQQEESAEAIKRYKTTHKKHYERQLEHFLRRNETSLTQPANLDFEF